MSPDRRGGRGHPELSRPVDLGATEPVRSPRNPTVAAAARLHRARTRRETGRTLLEGPNLLAEAIQGGTVVETVFVRPDDRRGALLAAEAGARCIVLADAPMARVAGTDHPRGPMAVIQIPGPTRCDRDVVAIGTGDPGNTGTLIRAAAAFGFDVAPLPGSADLWAPKVLRAGAGAHFHTRITVPTELEGLFTIGTVVAGGVPLSGALDGLTGRGRIGVLVGDEAHGLEPGLVAAADMNVTVEMPGGIESLNAGVAGSIVMYMLAMARKGGGAGTHPD